MIQSTYHESLKSICKSIIFVCFRQIRLSLCWKKYQNHALPSSFSSSKGLYSRIWKPNYFVVLYFGNTSYNHLNVLMKGISQRQQMWQVRSESDVVIRLLLSEFGLLQVPVLSLRLLGCWFYKICSIIWFQLVLQSIPNQYILYTFKIENSFIRNFLSPTWQSFGFNNSTNLNSHCFKSLLNVNNNFIHNFVSNRIIQFFV